MGQKYSSRAARLEPAHPLRLTGELSSVDDKAAPNLFRSWRCKAVATIEELRPIQRRALGTMQMICKLLCGAGMITRA